MSFETFSQKRTDIALQFFNCHYWVTVVIILCIFRYKRHQCSLSDELSVNIVCFWYITEYVGFFCDNFIP